MIRMNVGKLVKMAGAVRTGGKGSVRRKKKSGYKTAMTTDASKRTGTNGKRPSNECRKSPGLASQRKSEDDEDINNGKQPSNKGIESPGFASQGKSEGDEDISTDDEYIFDDEFMDAVWEEWRTRDRTQCIESDVENWYGPPFWWETELTVDFEVKDDFAPPPAISYAELKKKLWEPEPKRRLYTSEELASIDLESLF